MIDEVGVVEVPEAIHISDSLRTRVFHAAKDGMAITLYALLADLPSGTVDQLLQQVRRFLCLFEMMSSIQEPTTCFP